MGTADPDQTAIVATDTHLLSITEQAFCIRYLPPR